jgi:hypothetical protein
MDAASCFIKAKLTAPIKRLPKVVHDAIRRSRHGSGARLSAAVPAKRRLVQGVGRQPHVRRVDQLSLTADGAHAARFGGAVRLH